MTAIGYDQLRRKIRPEYPHVRNLRREDFEDLLTLAVHGVCPACNEHKAVREGCSHPYHRALGRLGM